MLNASILLFTAVCIDHSNQTYSFASSLRCLYTPMVYAKRPKGFFCSALLNLDDLTGNLFDLVLIYEDYFLQCSLFQHFLHLF